MLARLLALLAALGASDAVREVHRVDDTLQAPSVGAKASGEKPSPAAPSSSAAATTAAAPAAGVPAPWHGQRVICVSQGTTGTHSVYRAVADHLRLPAVHFDMQHRVTMTAEQPTPEENMITEKQHVYPFHTSLVQRHRQLSHCMFQPEPQGENATERLCAFDDQ